jgi:hypothetical protein
MPQRPPRQRLSSNALVLTGLATFRVVGNPEVEDVLANEHLLLPVAPHSEGCEFSQVDPEREDRGFI